MECKHCKGDMRWFQVPSGAWVAFDLAMVEQADVVDGDAFVPMKVDTVVVLTPTADVAPRHLEGVRWFARRHRCTEYLRHRADQRYHVDSLADLFGGGT